jgi:hypothetical protein
MNIVSPKINIVNVWGEMKQSNLTAKIAFNTRVMGWQLGNVVVKEEFTRKGGYNSTEAGTVYP